MIATRRRLLSWGARIIAAPLVALALTADLAGAQTRFSYSSGQPLEPAYEGWMPNPDGTYTLYFGYQNTNWVQEFDVPIGPENNFSPGNADLGQPTHFYPRRNPFLFTITVPKDFGAKEIVWTLTVNGMTRKAFGSLKSDYLIDPQVMSTEVGGDNGNLANDLRTNLPPDLTVEGALSRTVKVGQSLSLVAMAGDPDNLPPRRDGKPQPGVKKAVRPVGVARPSAPANSPAVVYRPPVAVVASAGPGLHLSWIVYRGKASTVTFTPDQMKTWTDTRAYGNSMWSPPYEIPVPPADGRWTADAVFNEPGTYVLRAVASDGAMFTYENVTVTVTP